MNRYIMVNSDNVVNSIRWGSSAVAGEIQSDIGDIDQIMQNDGTFITPEPNPIEPTPSLEEQISQLKDQMIAQQEAINMLLGL